MKKILIFYPVILLLLWSSACGNGSGEKQAAVQEQTAEEKLYDKVIEIHDLVMPKMADINRVKRGLIKQKESLTPEDNQGADRINKMTTQLETAEEAMMGWMRQFKQPEQKELTERMKYLESEKLKISKVSELMLSSLESGNKLLDSLTQK